MFRHLTLANFGLRNEKNLVSSYNYMFRHLTLTIFRLRNEKNLVSSYTRLMWVVYSGEVRGEEGTRSRALLTC